MPIGQSLAWKRGDLLGAAQRVTVAAMAGVVVATVWSPSTAGGPVLARGRCRPCGLSHHRFVRRRGVADLGSRAGPWRMALARAIGLPRSAWGTAIAHAGLGVTLLGLAATGWGVERIAAVKPGHAVDLGPYQVTIVKSCVRKRAQIIRKYWPYDYQPGTPRPWTTSNPRSAAFRCGRLRNRSGHRDPGSWPDLHFARGPASGWFDRHAHVLEAACHDHLDWRVVMAFGGIVSLSDRRLRIGFARHAVRPPRCQTRSAAACRMSALRHILLLLIVLVAGPARERGAAGRGSGRSETRGARAGEFPLDCAACLPEPVDR